MLPYLVLVWIFHNTRNLVMLLAVKVGGIMVQSAEMVTMQCIVQFFWLIFQVSFYFPLYLITINKNLKGLDFDHL